MNGCPSYEKACDVLCCFSENQAGRQIFPILPDRYGSRSGAAAGPPENRAFQSLTAILKKKEKIPKAVFHVPDAQDTRAPRPLKPPSVPGAGSV